MISLHSPVVLIEDNPDDVFILHHRIRRADVMNSVSSFRNGKDAVEFLSHLPADLAPRVVFVDLRLPDLNGLEVVSWIRSQPRFAHAPVAVCSGSMNPRDIERSYEAGADRFFVKYPTIEVLKDLFTMI